MKPALILPALLLCLAACKKEEVVPLKKETSRPTQTASANTSAPQKQGSQEVPSRTPLERYILEIQIHDDDRNKVSAHEALLVCKPSELEHFAADGSTFESVRESIAKYREDEKKSAAKLEIAKDKFLRTHPDPAIVTRIEAYSKELEERGKAYQDLNLKLHSDRSSYRAHRDELKKLEMAYLNTVMKEPSDIIAPPAAP